MDKLKEAFRSGIRKRATRSVNDGGLGLEDDEAIERYVDLVEKEADQLALSLAAQTEGDVEKSAAADNIQDELDYYLVKRAQASDLGQADMQPSDPVDLEALQRMTGMNRDEIMRIAMMTGTGLGGLAGAGLGLGASHLLGGGSKANTLAALGGGGLGALLGRGRIKDIRERSEPEKDEEEGAA